MGLFDERERCRWISLHELVRLYSEAAWRCKHCWAHFSDEAVGHSELPVCTGRAAPLI